MICLEARNNIRKLLQKYKLERSDVFAQIRERRYDPCVFITRVTEETYYMQCSRVACILLSYLSPIEILNK